MSNLAQPLRPHLLIVEDDHEITELLRRYFSAQEFTVSVAEHGAAMRSIIATQSIDVVLLDLGLPGEDGFTLTRYLREHWKGAIIIVTGRGESIDRVVGLELGADDYVTKPFDLRELLARVRSVLRRTVETGSAGANTVGDNIRFAGFSMDTSARVLTDPQGAVVPLTSGEFALLSTFLAHPQQVMSRDDLMSQIHGRNTGPYDRAIDVQIGRLRRKIEIDATNPLLIKSVRGAGYLFSARIERG